MVMTTAPDLTAYDVILLNTSGGKDSQAMIDYVVELAQAAGVTDRLVAVHADLGRVEWAGTRELAERQVVHYGIRWEVVSRPQGDLLTQIEQRGMFPSSTARYCTSDQKTGQVARLLTALAAEHRAAGNTTPVRILNVLGLRAEESPARAKKPAFSHDERASNGRRYVDRWLPLHAWTEAQVWARIEASGVEHHPAYDAGMPRLSCVFCVLSSRSALVLAAKLNPTLAATYAEVEVRIGHRFTDKLSMADIIAEAAATDGPITVELWTA
jgi:3'-phosphoadenosine 5'-phosphosulfate sulfotransferase (PAPS reductase)/FAD synthetase